MQKKMSPLNKTITHYLIKKVHEIYGHIGAKKCVKMILEAYFYPNSEKKTKEILSTWDSCKQNKTHTGTTFAKTQPTMPSRPGKLLSLDQIGLYPVGRGNMRHALVMIDTFSKYIRIHLVRDSTGITATRKLLDDYIPKNRLNSNSRPRISI